MKKNFNNGKSRLILNRPQNRLSIIKNQYIGEPGFKITRIHSPLQNINVNNGQTPISSISGSIQTEKIQSKKKLEPVFKGRSISCHESNVTDFKIRRPNLSKLISTSELNLQIKNQKQIYFKKTANDYVLNLRERGDYITKNNLFQLPYVSMINLLLQFGRKVTQGLQKQDSSSTKFSSRSSEEKFDGKNLCLTRTFSEKLQPKKKKKMSFNFQVVDFYAKFESVKYQSQIFWILIQKFKKQQPDTEELNFLLSRLKIIEETIFKKQKSYEHISMAMEDTIELLGNKKHELAALQENLNVKSIQLTSINSKLQQFKSFLFKQPNKILQEEALGYKQRQQELFDLAYMLQQSTPERVCTWIGNITMIPDKSFHYSMKQFFSKLPDKAGQYCFSEAEMESFKNNIQSTFNQITGKLEEIIEQRMAKIKQFVKLMQNLASYTVGKRQFLSQINKKMMMAQVSIERQFQSIQKYIASSSQQKGLMKPVAQNVKNLKAIVDKMQENYKSAEIFY